MARLDSDDPPPRGSAGDRPPELLRAVTASTDTLKEVRADWSTLTLYERFEQVVVLALVGLSPSWWSRR